jgi:hypothetical protein
MERLKRDGWEVYGPAETVKCPSTYTVRRDDRRGGPLTSQQILRRGQPTKWDPERPPPVVERRRLVWPDGGPPSGTGPFQRTCRMTIEENGPDTVAFIRVCDEEDGDGGRRYKYLQAPAGSTMGYRVCATCGVRLELCRAPSSIAHQRAS